MRRAELLFLAALTLVLVAIAIEPLTTFPIFGSDTGEYFRLTASLSTTGHLPRGAAYVGWGTSYPDFPGLFVLAAGVAGATGAPVLSSLLYATPIVAVLSVLPLFLLFRRLYPNDSVAVLGAGFATVLMPRLFSLAHPAPLSIGDFLVVGGLWMFVEGRRDARWYVPLSLSAAALIVTHHLSSYFFLLSALAGLLLFEVVRPTGWSRRFPLRELAFLGAFSTGLAVYWLEYATSFRTQVVAAGLNAAPAGINGLAALGAVGGLIVVAAAALAIRQLRRWRPAGRWRVRYPTPRRVAWEGVGIGSAVAAGISVIAFVPLPATSQQATLADVVFFLPVFAFAAFAAGSRRSVGFSRIGPYAIAWLGVLGVSAAFALATNNPLLIPSRHVEYLLIPLGLLAAVGLGRLWAGLVDRSRRSGSVAVATIVVVLFSANAAIVYPPPANLGGFQEGLTVGDSGLWMWVGTVVPPTAVVASDHRLSSMIFGFDGNRATWDSTYDLFCGSSFSAALANLARAEAPHGPPVGPYRAVNVVAVDSVMHQGVALDPSAPAVPMSSQAMGWFEGLPFVPVYENGLEVVYWVDGPIGAGT